MEESEVIDLNELICRTVELAQDDVLPSRVQLDLKLSPKSPCVMGHPAELSQVILNLLTDAVEASAVSKRSSGRIQITSAVIRDRVLASVIDDVPHRGARLRFHLARNSIRDIGGDLWSSISDSGGTALTIELPLGVSELASTCVMPGLA